MRENRIQQLKKGEDIIENQYIKLSDLRKVPGIGEKTIKRIKDMVRKEQGDTYVSKYDRSIHLDINKIYQGDCLELMNGIPDKSIDMILCDLPYGTTICGWDSIIPFEKLWLQYRRIIKENGAIVLFGNEPFSSQLRVSNADEYRYDWKWQKTRPSLFQHANRRPMKDHEDIMVFYKKQPTYNQDLELLNKPNKRWRANKMGTFLKDGCSDKDSLQTKTGYNRQILKYSMHNVGLLHPTQKPLELIEFLIKTYTNEDDLVLDNCIGSGTTAIACINTNRNYIGIELDENYYNIAKTRISEHIK